MFELPGIDLAGRSGWRTSLAQRLRELGEDGERIAYYYESPDESTFRYRCHTMVQTINDELAGVRAAWFSRQELSRLLQLLPGISHLVVCRTMYSQELAHLVASARAFGVRVHYDCDDLIFEPSLVPLIVETLDQDHVSSPAASDACWTFWHGMVGRTRAAMDLADSVIVSTEYLADCVREFVGLPVSVVPNFMSREQVEVSVALTALRGVRGHARDGHIDIGYFSGTPTHNRDFALAAPALAEVLALYREARLRLVGYLEVPEWFESAFGDRIERQPLLGYLDLQRVIAETEVNIVPLRLNRFTSAKSELKYFDAAAVGVPSVATATPTYAAAIDHNVTGLLVDDDDWFSPLVTLLGDYDRVGRQLGESARAHVMATYVATEQVTSIVRALDLVESTHAGLAGRVR